jgi:GNAT superfamily N-acetyltransferase
MVTARRYTAEPGFTADFFRVRDFLRRLNTPEVTTPGFLWARWEWAFCLPYLDRTALDRIGVWEDEGEVVALATFESTLGEAYVVVDPEHRDLLPAVVDHSLAHLAAADGTLRVVVPDGDRDLQRELLRRGLRATDGGDPNTVLDLGPDLEPTLPAGYGLMSTADGLDLAAFDRLLWRGFGHGAEPPGTAEDLWWRQHSLSSPGGVPELDVVLVAPDGEYAAYCGVWHEPGSRYVLVEPVCTDPDHRRRGCASAAITEALRRCAGRGAVEAYVGSTLPVYRALGFAPVRGGTWWARP